MKGCQNPHCKNNLRRQRCGSKTSCNSEFEFYAERQDQGLKRMLDSDVEVDFRDELESIMEVSNWSEELVICPETLAVDVSTVFESAVERSVIERSAGVAGSAVERSAGVAGSAVEKSAVERSAVERSAVERSAGVAAGSGCTSRYCFGETLNS
ncbi:uncharacterized protein LOC111707901 isoform X2 [Eurytemora carolleeae]|uniref:uncharacterized protein LOC111707901 isoform X2 n=1 Tax=Eurytemora carolleeae TaxID=1294199 RepID=UPI000C7640AF|nr:uncharacterized protein LOC111707901 isoform X2 [Eurytemora carolleeae]|eukprot:XP_023336853.1 uncharacterized protein LOC111707901 isoform X2 [Eurytemora affinis]